MGKAIIQGSGIQYSITINLSCWLLSSALISNSLNIDKMCIQTQYHWFSHQNNKKQANKNIYNTSYLCGSLLQLVNHEKFNLDKPSWAPPSPPLYAGICQCVPLEVDRLIFGFACYCVFSWASATEFEFHPVSTILHLLSTIWRIWASITGHFLLHTS